MDKESVNETFNKSKKYVFRLAIFFAVIYMFGAFTSDGGDILDIQKTKNSCYKYSNIANNVMIARQKGENKQSLINQARQGDPKLHNLFSHYIKEAYKAERVSGDENIENVARQFANKYYQKCLTVDG